MKAIAADPGERYRTAAELQEALDALSRPKSRTGLWVTLALVAVALAVAGTWLFTSQQNIVVPDVAGQSQADAESVLTAAGLKMVVAGQAASTSVAAGDVVSEDPPAGARVRRGAQIGVMVSTGKPSADVPSVTGLDLQTASSHLTAAGFAVGQVTTQTSTAIPDGSVISQSPAAGTNLTAGTAIDLVVSAAQVKVTVPVVTGTTQSDATTALEQLGFVVDITKAFSDQPKGEVVRQAPAAGSSAPQGSTVTLEISKGVAPVKVPDLTGAQESDAKTSLQNLGLVPVSVPTSGTPSQVGTVISQDPGAGTKVAPGSQVKIDIGK
jgi:serine/threonine-protein kinase